MGMKATTAGCAVLLAAAAAAFALEPAPCPDGSPKAFNGHPFLPFECRGEARTLPPPAPEPPGVKGAKKPSKKLYDPEVLFGRWEGLTVFENLRFEVFLEAWKEKRKLLSAVVMTKNYRTHVITALHALARPGKGRGEYEAEVRLLGVNAPPLKAVLRFGPVPPGAPEAARFDRQVSVDYEGRPGRQTLFFRLDGKDRVQYRYDDRTGAALPEPMISEGVLARTERETLGAVDD